MRCVKCGKNLSDTEKYEHYGEILCEDCYLDIVSGPKVCDPWAVYSAKRMAKKSINLTPIQQKILNFINERWPITLEEILTQLNINEASFKKNFAPLRHMELLKSRKKDNKIYYLPFDKEI